MQVFAPGKAQDRRFMAAAIRLSRAHLGLTATNPSVGTLIIRDDGHGPVIVGTGVTANGGRPHAEPQAINMAGSRARGATAYVTLEPCAHHGRTPPCANALVTAGISRVVIAASDPDPRVAGKGAQILRDNDIEVCEGVLADEARDLMAGYMMRSMRQRPEVVLKMALSSDGKIGLSGGGQVAITGEQSRAQVHLMRAQADAIMVGAGTVLADNPELTCRLPGLESRSPVRIILDHALRMPVSSNLVQSARQVPVWVATPLKDDHQSRAGLAECGVEFLAVEMIGDNIGLPELLEDIAGRGIQTILLEGGAETARRFIQEDLVDRICLFEAPMKIGDTGMAAPVTMSEIPQGFELMCDRVFGDDIYREWIRRR